MTRRVPLLVCLAALLPAQALAADLDDCSDTGSECQEDCLLQFGGSVRVEMKRKYDKCVKKCAKKANLCRERVIEAKSNALDEDALDKSPGARDVDESGMPATTARPNDDLRDDLPPPAQKPTSRDDEAEPKTAKKPKEALRDEEVPRSSRTTLKVEPAKDEPVPATKDEATATRAKPDKVEPSKDEPVSTRTKVDKVEPSKDEPVTPRTKPDKPEAKPPKQDDAKPAKGEDARVTSEVKPPRAEEPARTEPGPSKKPSDLPPEPVRTDNRRPLDEDLRDDLPTSKAKREEPPTAAKKRDDKKREEPRKEPPRRPLDEEDLRNF